jgi:S-(hydroxymethyl)glutathione dehydrogenase/alcohol dehydrogenase
MSAAGLCHTDDHVAVGDSPAFRLPIAGGHEGAGVVVGVGPDTPGWSEGDHVVLSFIAVCGQCRMCSTGRQNLCDLGARLFLGARLDDPTSFRLSYRGQPVVQHSGVSALSEYTVIDARSAVKIDRCLPLDKAALVSCGVATGWGSVTNMSDARPGADATVVTVGVVTGEHIAEAVASVRKAGTVVLTGTGGMRQAGIPINPTMFTVFQKRLQGALFGGCNPRWDIPNLLAQYTAGTLLLDELVTRTYTLDQVAEGYADMRDGRNVRGLVLFD